MYDVAVQISTDTTGLDVSQCLFINHNIDRWVSRMSQASTPCEFTAQDASRFTTPHPSDPIAADTVSINRVTTLDHLAATMLSRKRLREMTISM